MWWLQNILSPIIVRLFTQKQKKNNGENKIVKTFNSNTFKLPSKLTSRGAFYWNLYVLNLCGEKRREKNIFRSSENYSIQITSNSLYIYFFDFSQWKRQKKMKEKKNWNTQKKMYNEDECKETLKFQSNKNPNRHLMHCKLIPLKREKMALALLLETFRKACRVVSSASDVWEPTKSYRALIMCQQIERETMTWLLLLQH